MTWSLALNTPGEICRKILEHEAEVDGLVVFAITGRSLTWGMTGFVSSTAFILAMQILHAEATRLDELITMPVEGSA